MPGEGHAEGAGRPVAYALRDLGVGHPGSGEHVLCERHPPCGDIFLGCRADLPAKAVKEGRPGHGGIARKGADRKRRGGIGMDHPERRCQVGIGKTAQQSRGGVYWRGASQRFDQQHLQHAFQHHCARHPVRACFIMDHVNQCRQPGSPPDMDHVRQQGQKKTPIGGGIKAAVSHKSAYFCRAIGCADAERARSHFQRQAGSIAGRMANVGHCESMDFGDQDEVARRQQDRILAVDRQNALSLDHCAIERAAEILPPDHPVACCLDDLGDRRRWLELCHDLCEGVGKRIRHQIPDL